MKILEGEQNLQKTKSNWKINENCPKGQCQILLLLGEDRQIFQNMFQWIKM